MRGELRVRAPRGAERVRVWRGQALDVYAYFDNEQNAYAVKNALRLRELAS